MIHESGQFQESSLRLPHMTEEVVIDAFTLHQWRCHAMQRNNAAYACPACICVPQQCSARSKTMRESLVSTCDRMLCRDMHAAADSAIDARCLRRASMQLPLHDYRTCLDPIFMIRRTTEFRRRQHHPWTMLELTSLGQTSLLSAGRA